jgi:D-beta-D-heptose 7-phosphate kinase/D-beta-D-heptose 1-phosphate adenosyltransferase
MAGIFSTWQLPNQAAIFSLGEAAKFIKDVRRGFPVPSVILTSGGFDPIHPGHISCIQDSAKVADHKSFLVVVVNGKEFLQRKKGRAFMPLKVRSQIVSALRGVDIVVPFNPSEPGDMTVCEPLRMIRPDIFTKGGDRDVTNIPEADVCNKHNISIVSGVGDDKHWSSSDFLAKHRDWVIHDRQTGV